MKTRTIKRRLYTRIRQTALQYFPSYPPNYRTITIGSLKLFFGARRAGDAWAESRKSKLKVVK